MTFVDLDQLRDYLRTLGIDLNIEKIEEKPFIFTRHLELAIEKLPLLQLVGLSRIFVPQKNLIIYFFEPHKVVFAYGLDYWYRPEIYIATPRLKQWIKLCKPEIKKIFEKDAVVIFYELLKHFEYPVLNIAADTSTVEPILYIMLASKPDLEDSFTIRNADVPTTRRILSKILQRFKTEMPDLYQVFKILTTDFIDLYRKMYGYAESYTRKLLEIL